MASANFLEEALSTDVDESAVSALVGSLEDQLAPPASTPNANATSVNQNHVHSAISNGGAALPSQKHGAIANGDTINSIAGTVAQVTLQNTQPVTSFANLVSTDGIKTSQESVNIIYTQGASAMTSTGTIITNRATYPQTVQNGTLGNVQLTSVSQAGTAIQNMQTKQPTLVLKTSAAATQGLVTVPMNVTASVPQVNNNVVNVRPGIPTHPQKGQSSRVVLSAPQLVGARTGTPQLTLQSLQGLQPGQQGHLLLKTENGQYQLLRVGPAPSSGATIANAGAGVTFRMQTVPANTVTTQITNSTTAANPVVAVTAAPPAVAAAPPPPVAKPANDNTKEKCRKFLANLLELSSREPKPVERNVRSLIQDLIDVKVEPEDFCDRLEKLLNASPQPCLIGFLKKSLPLLRHSLATKELTIDGIRPPPANVVFSIASGSATVQSQVRPSLATQQVRLVTPGTTVVRPGLVQQRLVTPIRTNMPTRMVTTIRQPNSNQPVIVSSSQPPALHPVQFPGNQVIRQGVNIIRQPIQVRAATPTVNHTIRPNQVVVRTATPASKTATTNAKSQGPKPVVPSNASKVATKDREKKTVSSSAAAAAAAAYAGGDDDINDVAAMGGVNLAEETQRILGSTEFVGTQIRSCKEDFFLSIGPLQNRLRQIISKHGLDEPTNEIAAIVSHAAQERLKNLVEKLAIITEHRLEMVKSDPRYEVTSDIKGQLKFLEELDRTERKRHEEIEREMLLRAAKSRSKTEDPEQAKLKAKAKEMQRVEMEELRQREANATALQAIGPRKKPKLDSDLSASTSQAATGFNTGVRGQLPLKQRMKKVTLRDVQFLFESEKDLCKSTLLYKSYLK